MSLTALVHTIRQAFPGKPTYTDRDLPDLSGKVVAVTGSNTGVGREVAQMLYAHNATVYVLARSEAKARAAIDDMRRLHPSSTGTLDFVSLDLADLSTIRATAETLSARGDRLDVLFNNAGVAYPAGKAPTTAQGHELQMGVNALGTLLLTRHLTPLLAATARRPDTAPGSVRVVWVSSSATLGIHPEKLMPTLAKGKKHMVEGASQADMYFLSKMGNYLHGAEYASRHRDDGIVSVALNPGNLDSDLWRDIPGWVRGLLRRFVLYPQVYGAYTEVFAGFSGELTVERSGSFVAPWGRLWTLPSEYQDAVKRKSEGGTGIARDFWNWSEEQIKPYL